MTSSGTRPIGRPRSAEADRAILDAALELLARVGYARMGIEAVAARAGVSRATVYLRYRGKADLATAALAHLRETHEPAPVGDLRSDLIAHLRQLRRNAEQVSAMSLIGTCLVEELHTPELLALFRERTVGPRRLALDAMLRDAATRDEIARNADVEAAIDLMMGAYWSRYLSGEPFPADWEERTVGLLLRGLGARA